MKSLKVGKKECKLLFNLTGPTYRVKIRQYFIYASIRPSFKLLSSTDFMIIYACSVLLLDFIRWN